MKRSRFTFCGFVYGMVMGVFSLWASSVCHRLVSVVIEQEMIGMRDRDKNAEKKKRFLSVALAEMNGFFS